MPKAAVYFSYLHKYAFPLLLLVLAGLLFINNGQLTLWDQDEAAYAGFGQYFLRNPHAHIPQFMWSEPHRKTPLHFWLIAASYKIWGINTFAVRFPSTLAILLTFGIGYFQVKKLFSRRIALLFLCTIGTSFFIDLMAKMALTDGLLLLWSSLCIWAVIHVVNNERTPWHWVAIFWGAFALAVLTKGPPIIIFTGIWSSLLFLLHPHRFRLFRFHPWFLLPVALLPTLYWAYLTQLEDGGTFIRWFVDWYILKRVNHYVFGQTGPPGYYFATFMVFFLPVLPFFFTTIKTTFSQIWQAVQSYFPQKKETPFVFDTHFLIASACVSAWLFYEFLPSKLPSYTLMAHTPLALLLSLQIDKWLATEGAHTLWTKIGYYLQTLIWSGIAVGMWVAPFLIGIPSSAFVYLAITGSILGIFIVAGGYFWYKKQSFAWICTLFLQAFFFLFAVWGGIMPALEPMRNGTHQVATYCNNNAPSKAVVLIVNDNGRPPSLPFYLSCHFQDVRETKDWGQILSLYQSSPAIVLILDEGMFTELKRTQPAATAHTIRTLRSDRKGTSDYWVVIKKP